MQSNSLIGTKDALNQQLKEEDDGRLHVNEYLDDYLVLTTRKTTKTLLQCVYWQLTIDSNKLFFQLCNYYIIIKRL